MSVSRRRFVQFLSAAGMQAQSLARTVLGPVALASLSACRTLLNTFARPKRWVIPSIAGDFIIYTYDDPRKVDQFPLAIWARRLQFPAVAATLLGSAQQDCPASQDPGEIDSDQAEAAGVWVLIEAARGTRLFREQDIIRSDVLRMSASGDFTLSFSPHQLFPALEEVVPLTLEPVGPGRHCIATNDRAKLLSFDFCVRPDRCQGTVHSTLPTVVARWPERIDLLARPRGAAAGQVVRLHREPALACATGDLSRCGGPPRKLRWVEARYRLPQDLNLDVRKHSDANETFVHIAAQVMTVRFRPGFVDLRIPEGSRLVTLGSRAAEARLSDAHLHCARRYAFAWISQLPAETTTLPAELSSAFCLGGSGGEQWPLAPDPLRFPSSGSRLAFKVAARDVALCRVSAWRTGQGTSRSIEQAFKSITLAFDSGKPGFAPRLTLSPKQPSPPDHKPPQFVEHAVFDGDGRITAGASAATSDLILVGDLFARVRETSVLDLRFKEGSDDCASCPSSLTFTTAEMAWAGHQGSASSAADWVHLRPTLAKPDATDYRAGPINLETGKSMQVAWQLDRNHFQVVGSAAFEDSVAEMVALAPEAFRATLPTPKALPRSEKADAAIALPPFALREHRDFTFHRDNFLVPSKPAFHSLTMWEPRTAGTPDPKSDSPAELFAAFAGQEGGASVRPVYAGFAFDGALVPLRDRTWSPDATCHGKILAPYRAIAATRMRNVVGAIDVSEPNSPLQDCYIDAFIPNNSPNRNRTPSLQRVATDPDTELAISPIGGSIGFNWIFDQPAIGLRELVLRGFLGRYQKNYAIFADLLLPYGIRIIILNLTTRKDSGKLDFCNKWWFAESSKTYGDNHSIVLDNLRPINAVNFNENDPLLFKADIHFRSGADEWVDFDRTLQGMGLITVRALGGKANAYLTQTVALARPQALTLFKNTPMRLTQAVWVADPKTQNAQAQGCTSGPNPCTDGPVITVTAHGELEDVAGMSYDTRAIEAVYSSAINPDTGVFCIEEGKGDKFPNYISRSLTLGDGVVRVDRPLRGDEKDSFELNARGEHTLTKKVRLGDVGLMQLVLGGEAAFLDNEGTLTIHEKLTVHDKQQNGGSSRESKSDAEVDATLDFPEFTKGVSDVCSGSLSFRLKVAPRSFHASFKKTLDQPPDFDAILKADIGVPGLLALKNCELHSRSGQSVSFKPGDLAICGDLLKRVFELLLDKLKDLLGFSGGGGGGKKQSPFDFQLLTNPFGFLVKLRLALPRIPMGAGSLEHLTFDLRLALAIDISRTGIRAGSLMAFILGDYNFPGFGDLKWLDLSIDNVARGIFKQLRPPTLTITPFTVRFSVVIAVRVNPPRTGDLTLPNPFKAVCFQAAACISGEGGLALAFDIGVANGSVSITLGIVWCPTAIYLFDTSPQKPGHGGDEYFSFDEIALVARLELNASVLGIVNIFVRVEAMAQLKLTCDKSILTHLEVSGTASIEIGFFSVDVAFTVDLDPLLGIDPTACLHDKGGPTNVCALREPQELAGLAAADFFRIAEVAA